MTATSLQAGRIPSQNVIAEPKATGRGGEPSGRLANRGYIRELDGVRAIAVSLVFLHHYAPVVSAPLFLPLKQIGWIGVDIFFVISGFLITGILLDSPREGYYRNFYVRRALRIFPLYFALVMAVLLTMVLSSGGAPYREMVQDWGSPLWLFAFLGNVNTAISNTLPPAPFIPMWSLHVEEQFYLLFPFFVRRLDHQSLKRLLIAAIVIAPVSRLVLWWLAPDRPLMPYMLLPCRADGLALGGLIALGLKTGHLHFEKRRLALLTALTTAAAVAVFVIGDRRYDSPLERTVGYSLFSMAAAGLVIWIVLYRGNAVTNVLNVAPLQYLGRISYGLYLLQMPAASFLMRIARRKFDVGWDWLSTWTGSLILAAVCLVFATVSWFILERPILRLKDRLATSSQREVALDVVARA